MMKIMFNDDITNVAKTLARINDQLDPRVYMKITIGDNHDGLYCEVIDTRIIL